MFQLVSSLLCAELDKIKLIFNCILTQRAAIRIGCWFIHILILLVVGRQVVMIYHKMNVHLLWKTDLCFRARLFMLSCLTWETF